MGRGEGSQFRSFSTFLFVFYDMELQSALGCALNNHCLEDRPEQQCNSGEDSLLAHFQIWECKTLYQPHTPNNLTVNYVKVSPRDHCLCGVLNS